MHRPSRLHLPRAGGRKVGDSLVNCQRRRAIGTVEHPAPAGRSGRALRQPFASSLRAPACSDDARNAPADKHLRSLAQGTTPSDELTARQNRRPCNAFCSVRVPRATSAEVPPGAPKSHGSMAHHRWMGFQQESTIDANAACRGGERIDLGKNGSGVPGPLQFPQRSGVRDGQKHLPDMNTPATTDGYPWAINQRKDVKKSNR